MLTSRGDGNTSWENPAPPTDEQAEEYISAWLDSHPEATTTVSDNSITLAKLADSLKDDVFIHRTYPEITTMDEFVVLPQGSYVVGTSAYKGWKPDETRTGNLIIFKTGLPASTNFTTLMWLPQNNRELFIRSFTYNGSTQTYSWFSDWYKVPQDIGESQFMGRGNLNQYNITATDDLISLPNGAYLVTNPAFDGWIPTALKTGTLNVFGDGGTSFYKLFVWQAANQAYQPYYAMAYDTSSMQGWTFQFTARENFVKTPGFQNGNVLYSDSPVYRLADGSLVSESDIKANIANLNVERTVASAVDGIATLSVTGSAKYMFYYPSSDTFTTGNSHHNGDSLVLVDTERLNTFFKLYCVCYGDSITWYDGNEYNWGTQQGDTAIGYETWLRRVLGMSVTNRGGSGQTAPQIMNRVLSATDFGSFDFVTLTSGANDERHNTPLGTIAEQGSTFDTSTYIGAFQAAIEHILSQSPTTKIILCTPIQGWMHTQAGYAYPDAPQSGVITPKWANAIREIAHLYSLPVCDWYYESGLNLANRATYYNDPEPPSNTLYSLHPNDMGFRRMSEILISTFNKIRPI